MLLAYIEPISSYDALGKFGAALKKLELLSAGPRFFRVSFVFGEHNSIYAH